MQFVFTLVSMPNSQARAHRSKSSTRDVFVTSGAQAVFPIVNLGAHLVNYIRAWYSRVKCFYRGKLLAQCGIPFEVRFLGKDFSRCNGRGECASESNLRSSLILAVLTRGVVTTRGCYSALAKRFRAGPFTFHAAAPCHTGNSLSIRSAMKSSLLRKRTVVPN